MALKNGVSALPRFLVMAIIGCLAQPFPWVHANDISRAEALYLKEKGAIIFVSQTQYPPFEFGGSDGDHTGMCIDLVRWIATEFGFKVQFSDTSFKQVQSKSYWKKPCSNGRKKL
jgi:ABC-type amino acid transport substrate-binding protein